MFLFHQDSYGDLIANKPTDARATYRLHRLTMEWEIRMPARGVYGPILLILQEYKMKSY